MHSDDDDDACFWGRLLRSAAVAAVAAAAGVVITHSPQHNQPSLEAGQEGEQQKFKKKSTVKKKCEK
jgi:hypothetical protein